MEGSGPTLARFAEKREGHGSGGNPNGKEKTKRGHGRGAFESSLVRSRMDRARGVAICASSDGRGKLRSDGGAQRGREDARRRDAACGYLPAEGRREVPRPVGAHTIRQDRD